MMLSRLPIRTVWIATLSSLLPFYVNAAEVTWPHKVRSTPAGFAWYVDCGSHANGQVAPPVVHSVVNAYASSYEHEPAVLLSSRNTRKNEFAIALDFTGSKAANPQLPLDDRRQYVMEHALQLYMNHSATKGKAGQNVKLLAMIPPRSCRDDTPLNILAFIQTTTDDLADKSKPTIERLGKIEWGKALQP